jgi:hypothetical protein
MPRPSALICCTGSYQKEDGYDHIRHACKFAEQGILKVKDSPRRKPKPFQAEYEGSIPFTRSSRYFNDLARNFKLPI